MSSMFPSTGIAKKMKHVEGDDATLLTSIITVPSTRYGVIYRLWVSVDVATEADLENLGPAYGINVTIGAYQFNPIIHPYIEHTDANTTPDIHRQVDLGPWFFDFGPDGFYSGVKGDNIVVSVAAVGTGIKVYLDYIYSGD